MDYNVAQPKIVIHDEGDLVRAVIHFPSGPLNGRRPVIGPALPTVGATVAAALALALPVLVDIVTPVEYPDID